MKKQTGSLFVATFLALGSLAAGIEDSLKSVAAPAGEFVRMPARYIFQQLEKSAQTSGVSELGGFQIDVVMEGLAERKITVALDGMNILQALETVANATGAQLVFEPTKAVYRDPSEVSEVPVAVQEKPVEKESTDDEVEFLDIDNALVFVDTGVGRGSAFLMEMDDKPYLLSNQHNFMGANQLELVSMHGGKLEVESFEFNRNRDLVRFEIDAAKLTDVDVLMHATESPMIGQEIVVYGNSAGGNVATELRGEVLGVGPRDIEVDAEIVSGNSGSPILNERGRVIGVATYVSFELKFDKNDQRKEIFKGTRFGKTRRYGVRIPDDGWVKIDMRQFLRETYLLADIGNTLEIMHILVEYWNGNEDYEDAAHLIMSSYSSRDDRVRLPYGFHDADMEENVRMMVKAFKRNLDDFIDDLRDKDLSRSDINRMANSNDLLSTTDLERLDYHIRTGLLGRTKRMQDELRQKRWLSEYLEESAEPLDEMIGYLVRILENERLFANRVRAFN